MTFRTTSIISLYAAALILGAPNAATAQGVDPKLYSGLVWRNIGPFRGGRVSAVSGVIGQPGVFYMGLPNGGVWKTTSAGVTWYPVFDDIKDVSSIGAVEVAPSDPNVIYVGAGDMITSGISTGNGVYKSTDAGKTWTHMGLDDVKQIPSILVDPHDPNIVMVAGQGDFREKSDAHGLYRSTDGGQTWKKTLFVSNEVGVQKLAWASDHPNVMLATTVRHYLDPKVSPFAFFTPDGTTKLYKSTDEGLTWKEINSPTLPKLSARTCVAVAMNTDSQRMFLVGNFGLYRSDDGGATWRQMAASDSRASNGQGGYNCGVYVNPKNPDIVYVINTSSYISKDGGNTFTGFKGAPGGDDPQQMWLDPTDGNRLFFGTDQGATISLDGGATWSSWYNQPTAQLYHVAVDNQYPYWVYGAQQDTCAVATASRGNLGEITPLDWLPNPSFEFGYIVPDPKDSRVSYGGAPNGGMMRVTYPSGQWISVDPAADDKAGLRQSRDLPLVFSPTNPHELFAGYQYLMSTTDGGLHWNKLSPDLSKNEEAPAAKSDAPKKAAPAGGNVTMSGDEFEEEAQFGLPQRTINAISPSSVADGTIWTGTDNGVIKVTRNHGRTWDDASIHYLPNADQATISSIDASHHDAGTAYVAVDLHGQGDYKPYLFRTRDYGKTWTKIVDGLPTDLPSGSTARVVREDPKKAGLLFAGTESSVYVSFNDGDLWQPLALNSPNTSFRDLTIHGDDLVAATFGRGFWILDDIAPLREITPSIETESAHLFKPTEAIRVRRNVSDDTPFPPEVPHALNPPPGAIVYYYLGAAPSGVVTLEISDSAGRVVRHMSSAPIPPLNEQPPNPDFWTEIPKPMPIGAGTNRINWDLRYDSPPAFSHTWEINANPGLTPASPEGPLVAPGDYTLKLTVDGKTYVQSVKVTNDPRSPANGDDVRAQYALLVSVYDGICESWSHYLQVDKMRAQVAEALKQNKAEDLAKAGADFTAKLNLVGGAPDTGQGFLAQFQPPPAPCFALFNRGLIAALMTLDTGDMAPSEAMSKGVAASLAKLKTLEATWSALNEKDLPAFNAVLAKYGIMPIPAVR